MLKRVKRILQSYVTFTRSERRGVLVLIILTGVAIIIPYLYAWMFPPKAEDWDALIQKLHYVIDSVEASDTQSNNNHYSPSIGHLKDFNPNTISSDSLIVLGLPVAVTKHWQHYREKGGVFIYKEDVLKIYGVDEDWYNAAKEYILLPSKTDSTGAIAQKSKPHIKTKVIEFAAIELNSADTTLLMRLPGIGTKRAAAIVRYRNRLGGFYNKMQLREIRLVPDSVLEVIWNNINLNDKLVKTFNINTTPMEDLQQHPYIGKKMGLIIDTHRHARPIKDTADLMTVPGMDEKRMHKLLPYLEF